MKEIEIEFKNLLTEEEYNKIFHHFELENKNPILNKNYYYDDVNQSLKNANSALRIRYTDFKNEITLKVKRSVQNIEINIPLSDNIYPKEPTVLPTIPEEILTELTRMNVAIKTPILQHKVETLRYEIKLETDLLVLDKTTFKDNVVDYEIEFEVDNYNKGKESFEKLLEQLNIDYRPAKPKIARAVEYIKKNKN